jgi:anti-sigma28 factor (negative regulator of flagellin synthesis)
MRIDNANVTGVGGSGSFGSVPSIGTDKRSSALSGDEVSLDTVNLSNARDLIALAKQANGHDRQSRIASLTAQVRSGTYHVNSDDVSRAILKSHS